MQKNCDTLIAIPNQKLLSIVDKSTTVVDAFRIADSILFEATRGISDLINVHGLINLDFADVNTIMREMGEAIMGTGVASGEERAVLASQQAISSPLLEEVNISGAQGVLVNITGGDDLTLMEVDEATSIIFEEAGQDANIIFGAVIDPAMTDEIRVTVIATGFGKFIPAGKRTENLEGDIPTEREIEVINVRNTFNLPTHEKKLDEPVEINRESNLPVDPNKLKEDDFDIPAFLRQRQ